MPIDNESSLTPPDAPALLEKALEKSLDIKEKIEDCVTELSTVNEAVKEEMAAGITMRQAKKVLAENESVEEKIQECADELHAVNQDLAEGIGDRDALKCQCRFKTDTLGVRRKTWTRLCSCCEPKALTVFERTE
ncbi:MAG: hypothetical protein H0X43_13275 [Nitrosospira sp.]|nr:hypothetical protein [Nitrosospira sp.]